MSKLVFDETVAKIRAWSGVELPGVKAHQKMAPQHRFSTDYYLEREKNYRVACVLALLYPDSVSGDTRIILIERTGGDYVHAHQISFPGGKAEVIDENFEATALRETFEEIGVKKVNIEIVGNLSSLYIPPSKFLVYPFIGITSHKPEFILSKNEVENVLTPSLSDFKNVENRMLGDFYSSRGSISNTPYFSVEGKKIWGATAMMISELIEMI